MSEELILMMGNTLAMHAARGNIMGKLNWIKCWDINGISGEYRNANDDLHKLSKHITMMLNNIEIILSDEDLITFTNECSSTELLSTEQCEYQISNNYKPQGIINNNKALINLTQHPIPDDIALGLTFGWKFTFPFITTEDKLGEILAQLEFCIEDAVPAETLNETYKQISKVLKKRSDFIGDDLIKWLCFVALRTKNFFAKNNDIFATRSDKGGHTVIIENEQYDRAIEGMLNNDSYETLQASPLTDLIDKEKRLAAFIRTNWKIKPFSQGIFGFEPDTLQLAKFYGLPKIHKEVFTLRPITALRGAPGFYTGKVFDKLLNLCFPRSHFHLKDSYETKEFLDTVIIRETDVLVSFDVVSMYTSIPRSLVYDIIMRHRDFFLQHGMGRRILIEFLDFLLVDSTVFTACGKIFKQREGLPMGGCISTTIARVVMDQVIKHLFNISPDISFIRVFVDDTIGAMNPNRIAQTLEGLNKFHDRIKFTCENENEDGTINFLNLTLLRDENFIITNWYRKPFASKRLLNYYSAHKRTTIINTAAGFIRTVLELSDESFFMSNKPKIIETLTLNNFPETTILALMNEHYTLMKAKKPKSNLLNSTKFRIFPHSMCETKLIKGIIHAHKHENVIIAESTRNTKVNFVKTRKTTTSWECKTNIIALSNCVCRKKFKCSATKFNENGERLKNRIITHTTRCKNGLHAFRRVKFKSGLQYKNQTRYLTKYIKWKYRGAVINDEYDLPNYHFGKLIKNSNNRNSKF